MRQWNGREYEGRRQREGGGGTTQEETSRGGTHEGRGQSRSESQGQDGQGGKVRVSHGGRTGYMK